jgi:hypothetical protein
MRRSPRIGRTGQTCTSGIVDAERRIRGFTLETSRRVHRVHDRKTQAATRLKHPGGLSNGAVEIINIVKHHEGDDEIRTCIRQGKRCGIGHLC